MNYLERAIKDGHAQLRDEGKQKKIIYVAINHAERYSDPEEQVRAEFWAELVYRYDYDPGRIGIEVTVPDRKPSDRADLVIFQDNERRKPYAVVECKRDGITDAEFAQAVEQACGNGTWAKFRASYVGVVAGNTRRFFDFTDRYGVLEREKNIVADLPKKYGKPEEYKYYKGGDLDIKPVSKEELISAIRKCHQTLWGGGRLSPPKAFGELAKIIFVKISDEQAKRRAGEPYEFQIKTHESSHKLALRVQSLYDAQRKREPEVFKDKIDIDDATLRTVVSHLESINLHKTDLDTKGIAFEQFMDGFFKGDFGQYFTPREIIDFAVRMVKPTNDDIVLDPACGSGGFLLHALDAIRREADSYYPNHEFDPKESADHFKHWHEFAQKQLFGIEINEEIARVAKMNMIVHDDGHTNVIGWDALEPIERINKHHHGFAENKFDLILTNPPFGAVVKREEKPYLSTYEMALIERAIKRSAKVDPKLGKKLAKQQSSIKTEILFCEQSWRFLKPSTGRLAIVLPAGILTNTSLQTVRDWIVSKFQVIAIVSLPESAFSHFGAGVKASLVLLRKRGMNELPSKNEAVFLAIPGSIGYDATGRKCHNELPIVADRFENFQKDPTPFMSSSALTGISPSCFGIKLSEMDGPLNAERYVTLTVQKSITGTTVAKAVDVIEDKVSPSRAGPYDEWDWIRIDDLPEDPLEVESVRTEIGSAIQGTFYRVQENDILLARLGPTIQNAKFVICPPTSTTRPTIASTEFYVLRCRNGWNPLVVLWILRSKLFRDLMYSKGRGGTPSRYRLSKEDLLMLPFPQIDLATQDQLAAEIAKRISEIKFQRLEVEKAWSSAKQYFEKKLLGL